MSYVKNVYVNLLKNLLMYLLSEELTQPEKEVSEISSTIYEVKSKFLNLWWIMKYESTMNELWLWCKIDVIDMFF
jgi:hypothetical protein